MRIVSYIFSPRYVIDELKTIIFYKEKDIFHILDYIINLKKCQQVMR